MGTKYVSKCSCGFASEPQDAEVGAIDAYRQHEKGHEPGQRTGSIERINVGDVSEDAEAEKPAAKATGLRRSSVRH